MVSLAHLITICIAFIYVSRAKEVVNGKEAEQTSKWFGPGCCGGFSFYNGLNLGFAPWLSPWTPGFVGGCYGFGLMGGLYNNILFAKADDDTKSVARRAITLDSERLLIARSPEQTVTCVNEKGNSDHFVTSHCIQAANKLAEKKLSTVSCGTCTLSLVSPKDRIAPQQMPANVLQKAAHGILNACSNPQSQPRQIRRRAQIDSNARDVAMVLSKGTGANC